jgi:diguanylate cyclase (GGDEF)-like protein
MLPMRELISKLGRGKTAALITIASILLSVTVTAAVIHLFFPNNTTVNLMIGIAIAISVPLIVAPISSWYLVGLLLEIHNLEEKMRALATYDDLTGLLTRKVFLERAEQLLKLTKRTRQPLSFLLVDIDDFKQINDKHGHAAGDKALTLFGRAVTSVTRESDMACRFGGEEFAFCLPNTSSNHALIFARRVLKVTQEIEFIYEDAKIKYTTSIGVASYPDVNTENIDEILNMADKALYKAKNVGKNQTLVYTTKDRKDPQP